MQHRTSSARPPSNFPRQNSKSSHSYSSLFKNISFYNGLEACFQKTILRIICAVEKCSKTLIFTMVLKPASGRLSGSGGNLADRGAPYRMLQVQSARRAHSYLLAPTTVFETAAQKYIYFRWKSLLFGTCPWEGPLRNRNEMPGHFFLSNNSVKMCNSIAKKHANSDEFPGAAIQFPAPKFEELTQLLKFFKNISFYDGLEACFQKTILRGISAVGKYSNT